MPITPRLRRLLSANGTLLSVAIDHGVFAEPTIMRGAEDLERVVRRVLVAQPDALQLSLGAAERLIGRIDLGTTRLVTRIDVTNVYLRETGSPYTYFSEVVSGAIERALRVDAAAVVLNLLDRPGDGELLRQCIANISRARSACSRFDMPLMVEPLVLLPGRDDTYGVDGRLERILPLVRQAAELGADLIKADPTDDLALYPEVVQAAVGVPLLVRGGGRVDDDELVSRTRSVLESGARGIVYGRNIFQHDDPAKIVSLLQRGLGAAPPSTQI